MPFAVGCLFEYGVNVTVSILYGLQNEKKR